MVTDGERWILVLADAGGSEVAVGRRVAGLLKAALRRWKLRCLECTATTPAEQLARLRDEVLTLRRELEKARKAARRRKRCPA